MCQIQLFQGGDTGSIPVGDTTLAAHAVSGGASEERGSEVTAQLRFEPLTGTIGAVVHGLDIDAGPSDAEVEAVHRGLMDRHVLFFRAIVKSW